MEQLDFHWIDNVLQQHQLDKSKVIAIMQDIQDRYRYLPQEALLYIAGKLGISPAKIYGVATFYSNFSLEAKGKYVLKVCRGTACHVRRSDRVLQALYEVTGLSEEKHTTDDGLFSIEVVNCLGACSLSPVMMVNDTVHAGMSPSKVRALVAELVAKEAENT